MSELRWRKGEVGPAGGRFRARRLYELRPCDLCGGEAKDRHHVDGDTNNNAPENIQVLCRSCHMKVDGRAVRLSEIGAEVSRIRSEEQTHCKNGHSLLDPTNVWFRSDRFGRICRRCRADAEKRRRDRIREQGWRICRHKHATAEAREICERRLNRPYAA